MHPKSTASRATGSAAEKVSNPSMTVALWSVQAVLALLFLSAGGMKLVVPLEVLTVQIPLPGLLVRCIGVIEVLGAIGLILPALLRIRPRLTALAAGLLAIEMIVATVFTLAVFSFAQALFPLVVMLLAAFVAYGRRRLAPASSAPREQRLQLAG
jgi:hypothetical protein